MCHVDFFSRNPLPPSPPKAFEKIVSKHVNVAELSGNWFLAEQQKDPEISKLMSDFNEKKMNEDVAKTYELRSGVLYRKIQRNGRSNYRSRIWYKQYIYTK